MIQLYTKKYFFPTIILLFFCDIVSFALLQEPLLFFILSAYLIQCFKRDNRSVLIFTLILLALESMIYFNWFGLDLFYAIPAYYGAQLMQAVLYRTSLQPYFLLIGCLLTRFYIIEGLMLQAPPPLGYTAAALFANIIVMWIVQYLLKQDSHI